MIPNKVSRRITCRGTPPERYNRRENEQILCVGHALEWLTKGHVVAYLTIKIDHHFCDMYSPPKSNKLVEPMMGEPNICVCDHPDTMHDDLVGYCFSTDAEDTCTKFKLRD